MLRIFRLLQPSSVAETYCRCGEQIHRYSRGHPNGLFGYCTDTSSEEKEHAVIAPGTIPRSSTAADINDSHCSHYHMHEDLLRKTAKQIGVELQGQLTPCQGCSEAKGIRKTVKPVIPTRGVNPAERCFVDLAGPKSVQLPGGRST